MFLVDWLEYFLGKVVWRIAVLSVHCVPTRSSIFVCASATPQELGSWPWASEIRGKYCARHCAGTLETSKMQDYLKRKTYVVTIPTLAR